MISVSRTLFSLYEKDERPTDEREQLVRLMILFAELPVPEDPYGNFPDYARLKDRFLTFEVFFTDGHLTCFKRRG